MSLDGRYIATVLRRNPKAWHPHSGKPVTKVAADKLDELEGVKAELLAALRNCLSLVELKFGNTDRTGAAVMEQARAAIAKAEGGEAMAESQEQKAKRICAEIRSMSQEDRFDVLGQFCCHCGTDNPNCQCWNDE